MRLRKWKQTYCMIYIRRAEREWTSETDRQRAAGLQCLRSAAHRQTDACRDDLSVESTERHPSVWNSRVWVSDGRPTDHTDKLHQTDRLYASSRSEDDVQLYISPAGNQEAPDGHNDTSEEELDAGFKVCELHSIKSLKGIQWAMTKRFTKFHYYCGYFRFTLA